MSGPIRIPAPDGVAAAAQYTQVVVGLPDERLAAAWPCGSPRWSARSS
ncbi:hypothetical protein [Streptomyces sp. NPDC096132]